MINIKRENIEKEKQQKNKNSKKFTVSMQKKLVVLFIIILLIFIGLLMVMFKIVHANEDAYQKQILSQQEYDSETIAFRRGSILDQNGSVLAVSQKVYNLVIDAKVINAKSAYLEPTLEALETYFALDMSVIRAHITENTTSAYYVPLKELGYDEIVDFLEAQSNNSNIAGIWFEEQYVRQYPQNTVASDVLGFVNTDNVGSFGLEEYYNDILNGSAGRSYGYVNTDENVERTIIPAEDGYTIYTTLDLNIQNIVENYILQFNETYTDNYTQGAGADNIACIVMEVDTGNVLAMASYPNFDSNEPRDLSNYYTEEEIQTLQDEGGYYDALNAIWRNFCISDTFEPGSTAKLFTVATGLETGIISGDETYECLGVLQVADAAIKCNYHAGHGVIDIETAISVSCNVALMKIAASLGPDIFAKFQQQFNFGLKTNIDLVGEPLTTGLVYTAEELGSTQLATNAFGQGFNCTMIQMMAGYCSLINGGYYYEPHMVSKIVDSSGNIVEIIEPNLLKQVISESTSDLILQYTESVVSEGSGSSASPVGYSIGGKTGTAETLPRGNGEYIVSFIGHAPADDPEIAIYVVVDRPNVEEQANSRLAQNIAKNILTEVLPYLNIYQTEELTEAEQEELDQLEQEKYEEYLALDGSMPWLLYEQDEVTGYYIDPESGVFLDPETGEEVDSESAF